MITYYVSEKVTDDIRITYKNNFGKKYHEIVYKNNGEYIIKKSGRNNWQKDLMYNIKSFIKISLLKIKVYKTRKEFLKK